MKEWIISIVCVCIIEIVFFMLIPNGKLTGIIKSIFNFVLILVLISPIIKLSSNTQFDLDEYFNTEIFVQQGYLDYVNDKNVEKISNKIKDEISALGYEAILINPYFENDLYNFQNLEKIEINIKNDNKWTDKEHINITEEIMARVSEELNFNKEKIVVKFV